MRRFVVAILFMTVAVVSPADDGDSILPFTFTENGLVIQGVNFGQVDQGSFHQRLIVVTNTSGMEIKDVYIVITGNYTANNCMSLFMPESSCTVILNYNAPGYVGRDLKWLNIEFNILLEDEMIYSDSQRLPVVGGTLAKAGDEQE